MSDAARRSHASPSAGERTSRKRLWRAVVLVALVALAGWYARGVWNDAGADPERLWNQAREAWSNGRLEEAESVLARLAGRRPATVAERLLRAQVARKQGRTSFALTVLDGVAENDPEAARIWSARGLIEFERNRGRAAEAALLRAISLNPQLAEPRRGLIDLYTIEGRPGDLAAQFRALAKVGALEFDDLYLWTLGRRQDVGPADIAAKLENMLENDPDDDAARLALAENLRRLGRLDDAENALAPLPASDPQRLAATARILLDRGQVDRAQAVLASGPADHPALAQLRGRLALSQGDQAAEGHYRAALAASPSDRDALFGLGQALRLLGKPDLARTYLEAARNRDHLDWLIQNARSLARRDDPQVLREIGDACRSVRRLPEARAWYRLALARDPLATDVQKSLFELDAVISRDSQGKGG
jgi:tetratricopeptide (TPR) repeat protein